MNIFSLFNHKSQAPKVIGLNRISKFNESSSHMQSPDDCKQFGYQLGYNMVLDFYQAHSIIPEPDLRHITLNHWSKYIAQGKIDGHNQAVKDLIQQEENHLYN